MFIAAEDKRLKLVMTMEETREGDGHEGGREGDGYEGGREEA